jgi:hypothetical protein
MNDIKIFFPEPYIPDKIKPQPQNKSSIDIDSLVSMPEKYEKITFDLREDLSLKIDALSKELNKKLHKKTGAKTIVLNKLIEIGLRELE